MVGRPFDISKFRKEITKSIDGLSIGFNDPTDWISTSNYTLNYLISGDFYKGIPLGKVTVLAGESGCLPASAKVTIRLSSNQEKTISVGELRELYNLGQHQIEISTPDGFQKIGRWFDKGVMPMARVITPNFETLCAANHLIQLENGTWVLASELDTGASILTVNGTEPVLSVEDANNEECFDFEVLHPNHRYYGDGIVSHNSGKSFIASGNIVRNAQEQDIFVVLIDTENALDESWLQALGVDTSPDKLLKLSMSMIDDVAKSISLFMKNYKDMAETERPKVLFVIDSLGMLLTPTDVDQFDKGELKGDLGRKPKALTALVRNCVNMFGSHNVGMVATNHTYASTDIFNPDDKISGGCLTAGHKIQMSDGNFKNIEEVSIGDVVKTLDGDIEVSETFYFTDKEVFEIQLETGDIIQATKEHKFLTQTIDNQLVWKTLDELSEGDEILQKQ